MDVSAIQGMPLAPLSYYHHSQTHMLAGMEAEPREGERGRQGFITIALGKGHCAVAWEAHCAPGLTGLRNRMPCWHTGHECSKNKWKEIGALMEVKTKQNV